MRKRGLKTRTPDPKGERGIDHAEIETNFLHRRTMITSAKTV